MRVVGYLGLLAAVIIIAIMAVHLLKGITASGVDIGERRATKQINSDGDEPIDAKGEIKDTVRDALGH